MRRTIAQSPWDALLARVAARGGRPDAATAQQAFSLAVAPLPGVSVPKGPRGSIPEGTLATSWILADYGRLSPRVRQAVDRVLKRAFGLSGPAAPAGAQLDAVKAKAIAFAGEQAGVPVTLPITIVRGYPATARGAAALGVDAGGRYRSGRPAARCIISVRPGGASRTVIAHEVFHCLQIQLTGSADGLQSLDGDRAWLGEGSASYAGCLFSQDGAAPYRKAYAGYVQQPLTPLGRRTYDAVGFFAHLDQSGAGALGTVRKAIATPSMVAAYPAAANEGGSDIFSSWASSLYRAPARGAAWDVSGPCAPPRSQAAEPTPIVLGSGAITLTAPAYAAHPFELLTGHTTAGAIAVHVVSGHVRVGATRRRRRVDGRQRLLPGRRLLGRRSRHRGLGRGEGREGDDRLHLDHRGLRPRRQRDVRDAALPALQRQLVDAARRRHPTRGRPPPGNPAPPPLGPHVNRIAEENAKPGTSPRSGTSGRPGTPRAPAPATSRASPPTSPTTSGRPSTSRSGRSPPGTAWTSTGWATTRATGRAGWTASR